MAQIKERGLYATREFCKGEEVLREDAVLCVRTDEVLNGWSTHVWLMMMSRLLKRWDDLNEWVMGGCVVYHCRNDDDDDDEFTTNNYYT